MIFPETRSGPIMVDLRTIVGRPVGNSPIKISCLLHDDPADSMAVYHDHLWCFGCQRYVRRYASVALLLGMWNGKPETEEDAVKAVRPHLTKLEISSTVVKARERYIKPLNPSMADSFHRYLLSSTETLSYFKEWRGLTDATIAEFNLGWTGTAFSIPVYGRGGELVAMRYRADDRLALDEPKYSGLSGHNESRLYSMRHLCDIEASGEVWVFEGEFDKVVGRQLGLPAITMTNGAGRLSKLPDLVHQAGLNPSKWVIGTDADEAGDKAAWELQKLLGSSAVRARWPEQYKDISAFNLAGGRREDIVLDKSQMIG